MPGVRGYHSNLESWGGKWCSVLENFVIRGGRKAFPGRWSWELLVCRSRLCLSVDYSINTREGDIIISHNSHYLLSSISTLS
jgi:hypothetical protein